MSSSVLDLLEQQLGDDELSQLSNALGASREQVEQATATALPMLLSALADNASRPGGAAALDNALERDHSGGALLDQLGPLLGGLGGLGSGGSSGLGGALGGLLGVLGGASGGQVSGKTLDGGGILGHILGGRQPAAERGIGKVSGLDRQKVTQLLMILAPIVLAALARRRQQQAREQQVQLPTGRSNPMPQAPRSPRSTQPTGGGGLLEQILRQERQTVERRSGGRNPLSTILDADGDGSSADDILRMGKDLLGGFLGGGRR
jgi:hypothetical protein